MMSRLIRLLLLIVLSQSIQLHALEIQPRIIGGVDADSGEWPATAALLSTSIYNNSLSSGAEEGEAQYQAQYCGGSIIASKWILTAAHCLFDDNNQRLQANDILVLADVTDLSEAGQLSEVSQVFIHPNYNSVSQDSDIAMLELVTALVPPTQSIPLFDGDPAAGSDAMVVGWGTLSNTVSSFPYVLQEVELQIVSQSDCNAAGVYNGALTDNMLCAAADGKDSCGGDSGGPLMSLQSGEYRQSGIVSFGRECALDGFPGVYTRVDRFDTWISDTMAGLSNDDNKDDGGSFGWMLLPLGLMLWRRQSVSRQLIG